MTTVDAHLVITQKQAQHLLRDAARPVEIRLSTILSAAGVLFAGGVVGGFVLRAWLMVLQ